MRYLKLIFVFVSIGLSLILGTAVHAEGSRNLTANGGNRMFTQWNTLPTAGVVRQTLVKVYANAGEQINLGSSAYNGFGGDIIYRGPGGFSGTCDVIEGGFGHIDTPAKEVAGPAVAGGYIPCTFNAPASGIYEVEFHGPTALGSPPNITPNPGLLVNQLFPYNWSDPSCAVPVPATPCLGTRASVSAWDATVFTTPNVPATRRNGRVFSNALALMMGALNRSINSQVTILTNDGYQYQVNMNGMDANEFIFYSNTTGFEDAAGDPIYRSFQLENTNPGTLPAGGYRCFTGRHNLVAYLTHRAANTDRLELLWD
jgi:hypothetical protein